MTRILSLPIIALWISALWISPAMAQNATIKNGTQIPLWEKGAPGFEDRKNEPEQAQSYWVANIHNPSITAYFPPAGTANGTAVLIAPGGGHSELGFKPEGIEPAEFFNKHGVTAFALKYRLGRDKTITGPKPYQANIHARQDAHRAMRLIRSHAAEWGIDPNRTGVLGFSAGGEVASMVVFDKHDGDPDAADPIDRINSKADFLISIYPGGQGMPATVSADAPPAFLLATMEDWGHAKPLVDLMQKYQAAKRPVELHLFNQGAHGYNMGFRSRLKTIKGWPDRMMDWMADSKLLEAK